MNHTPFAGRTPRRLTVGLWVLIALGTWHTATLADTLDASVQRRLREAVVEVVLGKPEADPLTYERPLPLDLLPFTERNSKYRAIGTAFVVDANRFVTAAHVIAAGAGSQYGPLAIRDADGNIFVVEQITKYSAEEDYAEFTVRGGPRLKPLDVEMHPELNQPVFAVGDALGEGIVIRDGLYTSDTPEERSGRWKWLRFSAAASPGNSGGPLVDRKGRVIGVILRKSPNENLNSAVAIAQVRHARTDAGFLGMRFTYSFPIMLEPQAAEINERIPLPKPIAEFYGAATNATDAALVRVQNQYLASRAARLFPNGGESEQLLNELFVAPFPRTIGQRNDQSWGVSDPKPQRAQLDHNGFVESTVLKSAYVYLRLRTPDDLALAGLYGDSKAFMDMLLKALPVRRPVGSDAVRVTSLGSAHDDTIYKDHYGRTWQLRSWPVPYSDTVVLTLGLPTPQGYIAIARQPPMGLRGAMIEELETLADFTYASFTGTLKQWREYLAQPLQPDIVHTLDIRFDYGKAFHYHSARLALDVPAAVQKVDPNSILMLKMTYFHDGDRVVWDVGGVYLGETEPQGNWLDVLRRHRPPASLPDNFGDRWRTIETGAHPYTATAYANNGNTRIAAVARAAAAPMGQVAYTVDLSGEGTQDQSVMKRKLDQALGGVTVREK